MNDQSINSGDSKAIAALLGVLQNACTEMHGVQGELRKIGEMGGRLAALEKGQHDMMAKIDQASQAHQSLQLKYLEQSGKHELEIQAISLRLENYPALVSSVQGIDKKLFAYGLIAVVASAIIGALFAGLPAWLDRYAPQKSGAIVSPVLRMDRG